MWVHTVLFSGLRVNLAMSSHSAANFMNFSDGVIGSTGMFDRQNWNWRKKFRRGDTIQPGWYQDTGRGTRPAHEAEEKAAA